MRNFQERADTSGNKKTKNQGSHFICNKIFYTQSADSPG